MKLIVTAFLILLLSLSVSAQQELEKKLSDRYDPAELVSISGYVSFNQAIEMLSNVSKNITGKSIVSEVSIPKPIYMEINKLPYMEALNLIVYNFGLTYDIDENRIEIKEMGDRTKTNTNYEVPPTLNRENLPSDDIWADFDSREIRISAIFFEADVENSREVGIDWSVLLRGNGITFGTELRSESIFQDNFPTGNLSVENNSNTGGNQNQGKEPGFDLGAITEFTTGEFTGNATALLRLFEANNLGEIIASPNITVRDGQKGRIQIGQDFSIKQRDFSGNIIDRFYSAGTIIEVTPYVYNKDGVNYVLVKLLAERSSFFPSELTTVINKTQATSDILMLDGEETIIGGLYVNEESTVRNGIPILKDLPWWVLGIRYLTGSDEVVVRKKEVIIILRVELLPTLEERNLSKRDYDNMIKDKLNQNKFEIMRIKPDVIEKEK